MVLLREFIGMLSTIEPSRAALVYPANVTTNGLDSNVLELSGLLSGLGTSGLNAPIDRSLRGGGRAA
jgi:hypothetical protein